MLDADGVDAGADDELAVVELPPQAVRLSRAAAATPATVKVVRFIDCISVLLVSADRFLQRASACCRWRFRLVGTCPWLVSQCVFGCCRGTDGWTCGRIFSCGAGGCVFPGIPGVWAQKEIPGPFGPGIPRYSFWLVRKGGLEPPRPKAQEPKSCVSANFTTRAWPVAGNARRRMPGSIVAPGSGGFGQPPAASGIKFQVPPQLGNMAGCPDVVLRQCNLPVRIHHDG